MSTTQVYALKLPAGRQAMPGWQTCKAFQLWGWVRICQALLGNSPALQATAESELGMGTGGWYQPAATALLPAKNPQ